MYSLSVLISSDDWTSFMADPACTLRTTCISGADSLSDYLACSSPFSVTWTGGEWGVRVSLGDCPVASETGPADLE